MKKILLIIFSIAAFVACDKENHDQGIVLGTSGNAISITEATIAPIGNETEGDRIVFTITSDVSWKIQNRPSWLTIAPLEGKAGTTSVTMFAGINNQSEPVRTCKLRVEAADRSFSEEIEVSQERPYLKISRDKIDFTWDQCDVFKTAKESITINSNTDWEIVVVRSNSQSSEIAVSTDESGSLIDWLACSELRGSAVTEDHLLYFNPATYNIDREPKMLELEIRGALDSYKLSFTQANLLFTVDVIDSEDDTHYEFPACNTKEAALSIESELNWKVDSKPNWVTVTPETGKNITNVLFDVDGANPDSQERVGNLVFISEAGTNPIPQRVIEIRQKGYIFDVQPTTISVVNNDLTAKNLSLVSSGSWAIEPSSVPEWLDVSIMSGAGSESGESVAVAAKNRNLDFADRSAKIGFKSTQRGNTMSQSVDVKQDKFIFDAGISESNIGAFQTSSHDLTIHSSGDWTIDVAYQGSADGNWLNFEKLQGEGDAVVKYNAKTGNPLDRDRSAIVSVKSVPHISAGISNVVKSFDITQSKYIFEVEPTPDMLALAYGAIDDKSVSILVNCSIDWAIECPDWLIPSQRNGSNRATVTFKAQNNLALAQRNGKLVIKSTYLDKVRDFTFDVTQSAFEFNSDVVEFANIEPLDAGAYTVDVVCSDRWELRDCESWINASPTSGYGNAKITVRPADNVYTESRQNTFCVYSTLNGLKKNITVSQKPFVFDTRSETVQEFPAINGGSARIALGECMATWTVKDVPSWMTVLPATGSGSATLTITPNENVNTSLRTATIKVVSDRNSSLVKEITVSQAAFVFDTRAVNVPEFTPINPKAEQVVLGESMATWTVKGVPSWITVTPTAGSGSATLSITAKENLQMSSRSAVITVASNKNPALVKEITVSQAAFVFDTQNVNVPEFAPINPKAGQVVLGESMATWTVKDIPSWVEISPTSGSGSTTLTITPKENVNMSARTATIKVVSDKNTSIVKEITVSQAAFVFDTQNVNVPEFAPINPKAGQVVLGESMATWTVKDIPSWVEVSPTSGSGSATLTITPQENLGTSSRSATMSIVSDKNPEFVKKITVSQAAFVFDTTAVTIPEFDVLNPASADVVIGDCSAGWRVVGLPDWVIVSSISEDGAGTITVTASSNLNSDSRSGKFYIESNKNSALRKEITVSQGGYVLKAGISSMNVPASGTGISAGAASYSVDVNCSGQWQAGCRENNWCQLIVWSGAGDGKLIFQVLDNKDSAPREATIEISSLDGYAGVVSVKVSQDAASK